jgi:nitrous oxide reductase accessory protein NosL
MNSRRIAVLVILLAAAGAAGLGWYKLVAHPTPVACGYCSRPLHANLTVTAEIAGKKAEVCCARCAISEANQQRKPLRLITVHDYRSGRAIAPANAWFVEGSRAMACDHDAMRMNEMKGTEELAFDRCSPGTFSFADRQAADAFTHDNGGGVVSYQQLMSEARFQ